MSSAVLVLTLCDQHIIVLFTALNMHISLHIIVFTPQNVHIMVFVTWNIYTNCLNHTICTLYCLHHKIFSLFVYTIKYKHYFVYIIKHAHYFIYTINIHIILLCFFVLFILFCLHYKTCTLFNLHHKYTHHFIVLFCFVYISCLQIHSTYSSILDMGKTRMSRRKCRHLKSPRLLTVSSASRSHSGCLLQQGILLTPISFIQWQSGIPFPRYNLTLKIQGQRQRSKVPQSAQHPVDSFP